jgi:hypothetical protein
MVVGIPLRQFREQLRGLLVRDRAFLVHLQDLLDLVLHILVAPILPLIGVSRASA